jgi:diadenosine tetraphosphatase ApaH/serine/threonine PP2A family protein phosphatase
MHYAAEGAVVVKGNHDEAVEQRAARYLNEAARGAIDWARETLTREAKDFLAQLSPCVREGALCMVHASAAAPERWEYVDSTSSALKSMKAAAVTYTFSGHVHDQALFAQVSPEKATRYRPIPGSPVPVASHRKWLGLVGSVGQPRDGNPAAAYALFDQPRAQLTYFRIPYDHLAAAKKIRAAGLSEALAYRVERGI